MIAGLQSGGQGIFVMTETDLFPGVALVTGAAGTGK
jgi:hypothetical protein